MFHVCISLIACTQFFVVCSKVNVMHSYSTLAKVSKLEWFLLTSEPCCMLNFYYPL